MFLNKLQERKRAANGKPQKIKDLSMLDNYDEGYEPQTDEEFGKPVGAGIEESPTTPTHHPRIGDQAFMDLTDRKNDEFIYVY